MTPQQLEALVLAVVERAKNGQPIEDDRVEFKQDWPPTSKARQLGGSANRARGEYVVYVIGMDESGVAHSLGSTDAADWWAQMSSKFEGVPPEVASHLNVPVSNTETVVAVLFRTDRAPYVVKVDGGGSPELEVPIRDATRTRSARRDELLRMLVPTTAVPQLVLLEVELEVDWRMSNEGVERIDVSGGSRVYVEHLGGGTLLLPEHEMRVMAIGGGMEIPLEVDFWRARYEPPAPPRFGVHVSNDGVVSSGPGAFVMNWSGSMPLASERAISELESVTARLEFGVAGNDKSARVEALLQRGKLERSVMPDRHRPVARWTLAP